MEAMKREVTRRRMVGVVAGVLALVAIPSGASAAGAAGTGGNEAMLVLGQGSKLGLDGNSTLHRYKADASELRVTAKLAPEAVGQDLETAAKAGQLQAFQVNVPVKKLSSGEGGLDDNMWKALKADASPDIVFKMESYKAEPAPGGGKLNIKAQGKLSVAGVEKPMELDINAFKAGDGLRLIGSKDLKMSDFSVKAPVLMGGMIKTDDKVTIRFDLKLQPAAKGAAPETKAAAK